MVTAARMIPSKAIRPPCHQDFAQRGFNDSSGEVGLINDPQNARNLRVLGRRCQGFTEDAKPQDKIWNFRSRASDPAETPVFTLALESHGRDARATTSTRTT